MHSFNNYKYPHIDTSQSQRTFGTILGYSFFSFSFQFLLHFFLSNSPQNKYSNPPTNLRESKSNEDLGRFRSLNVSSPLRVDTSLKTKKTTAMGANQENLYGRNNNDRSLNLEALGSVILSEGSDLERLNDNLLDLAHNRMDYFINSVKQFVNVSGRLAKCVHPRGADIEILLKNFTSQKVAIENNILNMVTSLIQYLIFSIKSIGKKYSENK